MRLSTIYSRISKLEHMTDKTGYALSLDFFYFINRQPRSSAWFNLHVWSNVLKNIGNSKADIPSKLNL